MFTDTSRERHPDEMKGSALYHFVSERAMKAEINAHRYIEFGKHKQHLYGGLSSRSDRVRMHVCTGCKPSGEYNKAMLNIYPCYVFEVP